MHPHRSCWYGSSGRGLLALLSLAAVAACPDLGRADLAGPSLRRLLSQASVVALGDVTSVTTASDGTTQVATVAVKSVLAGAPPPSVVLAWNPEDPEGMSAGAGDRLLLMLRPAAPGGLATHEAVSPLGGVTHLSPLSEPPARALVLAALANGGDVPLAAVLQTGGGSGPHPPVTLVAAGLADLTERAGPGDGPAIGSVACAAPGAFQRVVRLWSLEQVGRTASQEGLGCARTLVKNALPTKSNPTGGDMAAAIAALLGLGDDDNPLTSSTLNTVVKQGIKTLPFATEKCAGEVSSLLGAATVALANTGDIRAASTFYKVAVKRPVRSAASSAVHGLRLIGDARAVRYLDRLAERHPDARIRQQALESLAGLAG